MATGKEYDLMSTILSDSQMSGVKQPCPACGGRDRFRFIKKNNRYYCSGGGSDVNQGDWFSLLAHIHPTDYFDRAHEMLGVADGVSEQKLAEIKANNEKMEAKRAKKAKQRELRRHYDKQLNDNLYSLETMIGHRKYEVNPCADEVELAQYVIELIKDRYKLAR